MTNFELSIHERRKNGGELSSDEFDKYWILANSKMFGKSINILNIIKTGGCIYLILFTLFLLLFLLLENY